MKQVAKRMLSIIAILCAIVIFLLVFIYSPYYSKMMVAVLKVINPATVNPVTAQYHQPDDNLSKQNPNEPYAIVVLGGGLTREPKTRKIIINKYTQKRLELTLEVMKSYPLPIVLSGVEAPYMQKWLKQHGVKANLLEKKSMNTCENSKFSSLLLQQQGGAPTILLITDEYHMPRTRRLFAQDGIATIPIVASMPTERSTWLPSQQNYHHSRRATYEFLATLRDQFIGTQDCRDTPS